MGATPFEAYYKGKEQAMLKYLLESSYSGFCIAYQSCLLLDNLSSPIDLPVEKKRKLTKARLDLLVEESFAGE